MGNRLSCGMCVIYSLQSEESSKGLWWRAPQLTIQVLSLMNGFLFYSYFDLLNTNRMYRGRMLKKAIWIRDGFIISRHHHKESCPQQDNDMGNLYFIRVWDDRRRIKQVFGSLCLANLEMSNININSMNSYSFEWRRTEKRDRRQSTWWDWLVTSQKTETWSFG